mgnify:CR=1 FL=1
MSYGLEDKKFRNITVANIANINTIVSQAISTSGAIRLPNATTDAKNNMYASAGMIVFDTDEAEPYVYNGSVWIPVSDGGGSFSSTDPLVLTNTSGSSDTNSGALVVSGGVGIGENLNVDGSLTVRESTAFGGRVTSRVRDITASVDSIADDHFLVVTEQPSGGHTTLNLPPLINGDYEGVTYHIVKVADNNTGNMIVQAQAGDNIIRNGSPESSLTLPTPRYTRCTLISCGRVWYTM